MIVDKKANKQKGKELKKMRIKEKHGYTLHTITNPDVKNWKPKTIKRENGKKKMVKPSFFYKERIW